jgi:hypothetical protein
MNRVFVLSPANCNGVRARCLLRKSSSSKLAKCLRGSGVPLSEVFSFVSSLYFRGKISYARLSIALEFLSLRRPWVSYRTTC